MPLVTKCAICGGDCYDIFSFLCKDCNAVFAKRRGKLSKAFEKILVFRKRRIGFAELKAALDDVGIEYRPECHEAHSDWDECRIED